VLPERWFERGRIVLGCNTYQVRQVGFEYLNQATVVVDFLDRQTNPTEAITRESLLKGLPKGWKREEVEEPNKEKK
jgi:predicted GIY-YIG superfamily endonuclease